MVEPRLVASQPLTSSLTARVERAVWAVCVVNVAVAVALTFGFFTKAGWATALWPWPEPGMTYIFLASIAAAIGAAWLCVALTREYAALAGIGLNIAVVNAGVAIFLTTSAVGAREARLLPAIGVCLVFALLGAAVFGWSRRLPLRDRRPMPRLVWWSFVGFAVILILVGSTLGLQVPGVFPWTLHPPTSTIVGLIFLGAATYFVLGVARARWAFAASPLWSFLAYDIVLFVPYGRLLAHKLSGADGTFDDIGYGGTINEQSLLVYLAVLTFSMLLALYALFVRADTRLIRPHRPHAA